MSTESNINNFKVADISLSDFGRKEIELAEKEMPGLMSLKEDLGLPPEVDPKSQMGQNLREIKKTSKEMDLKGKEIQDDI